MGGNFNKGKFDLIFHTKKFEIENSQRKEMKKGFDKAIADSIILEPNFAGMGFSFNKFREYFRKKKKKKKKMNNQHQVELNFVYLHKNDALWFVERAEEDKSKTKSIYARHAILSCVFAIEALVNKILNDFYILPNGFKSYEKLGLRDKLFTLPLVCGKDKPIGKTFNQSKEPFQSFAELVAIRNWLVHPKNGQFVEAHKTPWTITIMETGEDVPWIETDKGTVWSITQIPLNPFELTGEHARKAFDILESIISELILIFEGLISDIWMEEIIIRDKNGNQKDVITINSLYGGYTPNRKNYLEE